MLVHARMEVVLIGITKVAVIESLGARSHIESAS